MRDGIRIVDIDTHVQPAMELLHEHASRALRDRWEELTPYFALNPKPRVEFGEWDRPYNYLSVAPFTYDRPLGVKATGGDEGAAGGRTALKGRIVQSLPEPAEAGIMHDNAEGRLRAMDREGADVHLIIAGTFAAASTALEISLSVELMSAYNRYIIGYCAADPSRLKAAIVVNGGDPEWSARTIRQLGKERCVAAVNVLLPEGLPVDDPDLHPIWRAMQDENLGILHHSFFYEPPYFPGYRDIWGNVVVARTAAHPWGAQRLVAYLILSGLFDRYPNLRVGFAEVGAGWLPFWLRRLNSQVEYMRGMVPDLERAPVEYAQAGHVYSGLELYEGHEILRNIVEVCGDGVAMYQSDFPHAQSRYPFTPDDALSWDWSTIGDGEKAKRKFFAENAEAYLRLV